MFTVGIDLAKRKSQFAVLDDEGRWVVERSLPNERRVVQKFIRSLAGKVQVGCETCPNTYWLVEVLEEIGVSLSVAHAGKLKLIAESRQKTDKIDARVIAESKRAGFFPEIAIPPREIRQVRELLRSRVMLVRTMTQFKNRLHGLLTRAGVDYRRAEVFGPGAEAWVEGLSLSPPQRFVAQRILTLLGQLRGHLTETERELKRSVQLTASWKVLADRLASIPGVGEFSAMLLLLELWDIGRFASPKKLAAYVGLVPSTYQSGQVCYGGRLTKQGNPYVRWILIQDAWAAVRSGGRYRALYEHYRKRQGASRAIVPVARHLLEDVYKVWMGGITYPELVARRLNRQKQKCA